jgi:hypothetical protein
MLIDIPFTINLRPQKGIADNPRIEMILSHTVKQGMKDTHHLFRKIFQKNGKAQVFQRRFNGIPWNRLISGTPVVL